MKDQWGRTWLDRVIDNAIEWSCILAIFVGLPWCLLKAFGFI